jgi:hypothetical protein
VEIIVLFPFDIKAHIIVLGDLPIPFIDILSNKGLHNGKLILIFDLQASRSLLIDVVCFVVDVAEIHL